MQQHFNPLPPCGGRQYNKKGKEVHNNISIHSLRVEGDSAKTAVCRLGTQFQSTPSVWRETTVNRTSRGRGLRFQSTPSVWRETAQTPQALRGVVFQSTPSVWRETCGIVVFVYLHPFQSTPSVWRETATCPAYSRTLSISIHSLRVEGDLRQTAWTSYPENFNPLPPCGGRP